MEDRKQKVGKGRETEGKDTKEMVKGGNGKKRHNIKGKVGKEKERWGRKRKERKRTKEKQKYGREWKKGRT